MKRKITAIFILLTIVLTGCSLKENAEVKQPTSADISAATQAEKATSKDVSFVDALGNNVTVHTADKVIALSGSFADTWLLAGGSLVGTTTDAFSDGIELDENVANVGSLHNLSLEQVIALEPDFVILSKTIANQITLYEQLKEAGITAACFSVEEFSEYLDMLKICTDITGRSDLYEKNGTAVKTQIDDVVNKANAIDKHPTVLFLRASSTEVSARNSGTMAGAMLKDLGCVNIADNDDNLLENLSIEAIIKDDPDYIFAVTMGGSEEKALAVLEKTLKSNPAWAGLNAVKDEHYDVLAKDLFHLKPNNRWGESYETLFKILYAE
ncbi:hypothetical protein AGMMS50284_7170 [Clostridia bacterium]|nr:hypothetical protein AGMMS50284_7170 [Clostridia bacterium]